MVEGAVVVRGATESDDVSRLGVDDPFADWYQLWQQFDSEELAALWFVATVDDVPVGVAAVVPAGLGTDGAAPALLTVRREHRGTGVGTALRRAVEQAARAHVPAVLYRIIAGEPDSEAAVAAWGLARGPSHAESVLDLTAIDRGRFEARAAVAGVEIATLPDLRTLDDRDWHELHDFVVTRTFETPDATGADSAMPSAAFRTMVQEPWMMSTARVGADLVGITYVLRLPGGDVNTSLTGVLTAFRGRGIASALKCSQALVLADLGHVRLITQNLEGNEPILAANRSMGFVHHRTEVEIPVSVR